MNIATIIGVVTLAPLFITFISYLFYRYARFVRRVPHLTRPKEGGTNTFDVHKKTFKILSLNVKMIDWHTAIPTLALSLLFPHKRRKKIVEFLQQCDHDVVVLQEAFNIGFQEVIKKELRSIFPYQLTYLPRTRAFRWINNGLMTLSRFPLSDPRFLEFQELRGADGWVPKGATLVTVDAPKPFQIFNTHMQAFEGLESDRLRVHGITEIRKFLEENTKPDTPTILGGDFNTSRRHAYLRAMLKVLRVPLYRLDGELKFSWDPVANPLCKPGSKERGTEPETLDWLFVRDFNHQIKHTIARVIPVSLSDHYPIEREFVLD